METIAVYWEDKIKTYGLDGLADLSWITLKVSYEHIEFWSNILDELSGFQTCFRLVMARTHDAYFCFYLLFDQCSKDIVSNFLKPRLDSQCGETMTIVSPVELIHFHGPHFGERYGIADAAFRCLAESKIPVLAAACSASSIYLVFSTGCLNDARTVLSRAFSTPVSKPSG